MTTVFLDIKQLNTVSCKDYTETDVRLFVFGFILWKLQNSDTKLYSCVRQINKNKFGPPRCQPAGVGGKNLIYLIMAQDISIMAEVMFKHSSVITLM